MEEASLPPLLPLSHPPLTNLHTRHNHNHTGTKTHVLCCFQPSCSRRLPASSRQHHACRPRLLYLGLLLPSCAHACLRLARSCIAQQPSSFRMDGFEAWRRSGGRGDVWVGTKEQREDVWNLLPHDFYARKVRGWEGGKGGREEGRDRRVTSFCWCALRAPRALSYSRTSFHLSQSTQSTHALTTRHITQFYS